MLQKKPFCYGLLVHNISFYNLYEIDNWCKNTKCGKYETDFGGYTFKTEADRCAFLLKWS